MRSAWTGVKDPEPAARSGHSGGVPVLNSGTGLSAYGTKSNASVINCSCSLGYSTTTRAA
jgi:hypothetical protein